MCGIAGFLDKGQLPAEAWHSVLEEMGRSIAHRGPDDAGAWIDVDACVALTHRRLSIVDLSPAGHQPMVSASGRYVMVFNGEIYNHLELRSTLEKLSLSGSGGIVWRGHSDTETLLAGIDAWGLKETLQRSVGMFAIALWDRRERSLSLARDRLGEKPLYCGWQRGVFLFGSELKALKAHPAFEADIDREAIALFLRHSYVPSPYSIYQGVGKLPPGTILELDSRAFSRSALEWHEAAKPYWSLMEEVERGLSEPFKGNDAEAVEALDSLLRDAVSRQSVADVPLGAFLSGGVDSSTIVALMQSQSTRPVRTFTIGFHEEGYNEAEHAKAVAQHLGTEHTDLYVTAGQALDVVPRLPKIYDEPFADCSQIPTFLVSEMTRQHVTVSVSGDAGDELFGGYTRYFRAARLWRWFKGSNNPISAASSAAARALSVKSWDSLTAPIKPFLPAEMRNVGDKMHKLADLLAPSSRMEYYRQFVSHWQAPEDLVIGGSESDIFFKRARSERVSMKFMESMMLADSLTYLPDDILAKVDRAAMATSLETRVPLLDHRVVEFAWRLPLSMKIRSGQGKWILRQVLYKYVPRNLIERPKMGFGVPIDLWLRGPLRDWAEGLLDEARLRQEGFFNPTLIRQKWSEHLSGRRNWQYHIWDILMFQAWCDTHCAR